MTYRVTTHTALVSNLAAANTTVMLCRANIERIQMTPEEQSDLVWRVQLQMRELEGILAHLRKANRVDVSAEPRHNVVEFRSL